MKTTELQELERILGDEPELQPLTGFSTRVMRAVREEAAAPPPIVFPWRRFASGFGLSLGVLLMTAMWLVLEGGAASGNPAEALGWFADPRSSGLLWATAAMLSTSVLMWVVSKWVSPRQVTYLSW